MSQQLHSLRIHCSIRPPLPKLDIPAVDEEPHEEWEAEDDVKGGPLDPREVKNAREKEIQYLWDMEEYEWHLKFDRCDGRRTDFEQFGHTDNCPGCANARAGRKQAVDHSEQCRSRVETILVTTTEGHERLTGR